MCSVYCGNVVLVYDRFIVEMYQTCMGSCSVIYCARKYCMGLCSVLSGFGKLCFKDRSTCKSRFSQYDALNYIQVSVVRELQYGGLKLENK